MKLYRVNIKQDNIFNWAPQYQFRASKLDSLVITIHDTAIHIRWIPR